MRITAARQLAVGLSALASITLADGEIFVTYMDEPGAAPSPVEFLNSPSGRRWSQANEIREIQRANRGIAWRPVPKEGLPRR